MWKRRVWCSRERANQPAAIRESKVFQRRRIACQIATTPEEAGERSQLLAAIQPGEVR